MFRRPLRFALILTVLAATAAGLALWLDTRTPLPARAPSAASAVDLTRYRAGELQFPGERWEVTDPALLGWSPAGLESARRYAESLDTGAVMIVDRGVDVAEWGRTGARLAGDSIRKSLLSSLYGRLLGEGRIHLDDTLAELGIDDDPPLTESERRATVEDLLLSRSGVNHSALYEAGSWKRNKPTRGSDPPGTAWYYNNWGFNALGTIFVRAADTSIGGAFGAWVADPIGMQDFRLRDVHLLTRRSLSERAMGNRSDHAAYVFDISARDLARFGLLYLAGGRWGDRRVLPEGWAERSTFGAARPTESGDGLSYGYMWWIVPPGPVIAEPRLLARGGRGHQLAVFPERGLVIVHRIPTRGVGLAAQLFRRFVWHAAVSDQQIDELYTRILGAAPTPTGPADEPDGELGDG